jgi:hypothetical protein
MFGTGSIETGSGNVSISGGVATFSVAQTGNIGAGVCVNANIIDDFFLAPNRIGFDAGSTEIKVGDKIADATSGATGIVRFVEVTGGTWAGNDAAGWIYFEETTGTFGDNNVINITKPTVTNSVAVINGTIQGNMGGLNTQFACKTATGGTPANTAARNILSINHVWATVAAFEGAFTGASYINNASLVAADVVAHCCWYYDHDNYTTDSTSVALGWSGTQDATRYLQIFTPTGGAESINNQRHSGIWDSNKAKSEIVNSGNYQQAINIIEGYTRIQGLQLQVDTGGNTCARVIQSASATGVGLKVDSCILVGVENGGDFGHGGLYLYNAAITIEVINTILYGCAGTATNGFYFRNCSTADVFHCTVSDIVGDAIERDAGTVVVTNCAVFNNTDDFDGTITCDYCASDDADAPTYTNGVDWNNGSTDWANVFNAYATGDFTLNNYTVANIALIEQGTSLAASEGIWRDIAGNERGATPDIGAFEYVAAEVGWTGIINTIINPAKINNIVAANIKSVNTAE